MIFPGVSPGYADSPYNSIDVAYYKGLHISDTIPALLEAGAEYPITITFRNAGMVSWGWNVEKFGLLYTGQQSSIGVTPDFFALSAQDEIKAGQDYTFAFTLIPPEKTGDYEISFSMATKKGEAYNTFIETFKKKVKVIPQSGLSSGSVGSIIIDSIPASSEVYIGRDWTGITPFIIPDLIPASYEVSVSSPEYKTKVVLVTVEPGSTSRLTVDLTSSDMPEVVTEKAERYTLLGFLKENLPLLILTIAVLFFGFQMLMLDTTHFPETHPVRRYARPFTIVPVNFSSSHRNKAGSRGGKAGLGGTNGDTGSEHAEKRTSSTTRNFGKTGDKTQKPTDKKVGYGDGKRSRSGLNEEDKKSLQILDEDQDYQNIDNPFGFPDGLKDQYEPLGIAGDDPYARVFKVRKKENGSIRALKVAHVKNAGSEILQKESSVWGNLRHPNVVRLFKAEFDEDLTYLDIEFLDGIRYRGNTITSLSLLPKPIKEKYAVSLIRDIAAGLQYTHQLGIRHYHLQTGDILLTPTMRAKISGYARGKNELGFSVPESDTGKATAAYLAPEQKDEIRFGNPGRKTDLYQLGVIFYELLTGHLPYSPGSEVQAGITDNQHMDEIRLILPSEYRSDLSRYDLIISRLLSQDKQGRYSSVDEFITALNAISSDL